MKLYINGLEVTAQPGQSLRQLVAALDLDSGSLAERPLAAKLAGEVFNLNYVPVRATESGGEKASVRRAMAASGGVIRLLRYPDAGGREAYTRTAQFILFLALNRLYPSARAKMNCTVGKALYIEVDAADFSTDALKREVARIVAEDFPLSRIQLPTTEAAQYFLERGQTDKARLLSWREAEDFSMYIHEDFADYYYGELAPSTGYLQVWDILPAEGGFMFLFPDDNDPDSVAQYEDLPKLLSVSMEGQRWCELMECENVADLNELVRNGAIRELIRVNEALHEKRYAQVADLICQRNAKAVMLAGPSSSGKTTSANRLATQLRVHGKKPVLLSLDDYYIDRDKIPALPDGTLDLEHINTIDTGLFSGQAAQLLAGETVEIPSFNFVKGKREWLGRKLRMQDNSVIIVEGLHALNPALLPDGIDENLVFRLYVSPLIPLNLDDHNRIPTSMLRLLRRIVRDYEMRGASVQKTMSMWESVRAGERRWIFPFQERADVIFNSSTLYELAVLKKHIFPLLTRVQPEDQYYEQVRALVKILNYVQQADVDDEIPPTSLVREFIGGNTFYR